MLNIEFLVRTWMLGGCYRMTQVLNGSNIEVRNKVSGIRSCQLRDRPPSLKLNRSKTIRKSNLVAELMA